MSGNFNISNNIYIKAIERAGFTLEEYAKAHTKSNILLWLEGKKCPTYKQLDDFAKSVNIPVGYLFMSEFPIEKIPFTMFRGKGANEGRLNLNVYDTVMSISQRQEWIEDYLIDNDIETCHLVGSISLKTPLSVAVKDFYRIIGLGMDWASEIVSVDKALNSIITRLEQNGIFVVFNGIVGNNTKRKIEVSDCRGFCLVNKTAPFIFVNASDSKNANMFTLVHEIAHILLGISAGHAGEASASDDQVENFCDSFAAEFLMPEELVVLLDKNVSIDKLSKRFKVSKLVVARRLHDLDVWDDARYNDFISDYYSNIKIQKKAGSGGNYYATAKKRIGLTFALHVNTALKSNQISYLQAYRLTGLHGDSYTKFFENVN